MRGPQTPKPSFGLLLESEVEGGREMMVQNTAALSTVGRMEEEILSARGREELRAETGHPTLPGRNCRKAYLNGFPDMSPTQPTQGYITLRNSCIWR